MQLINLLLLTIVSILSSTSVGGAHGERFKNPNSSDDLNFGQPVGSMAFSGNGEFLAVAARPSSRSPIVLKVWSTKDWRLVYEIESSRSFLAAMSFSPSSKLLAIASSDLKIAEIVLYDARTGKELGKYIDKATLNPRVDNALYGMSFSPDERTMAISQASGELRQVVKILSIENLANISVRNDNVSASSAKKISLTFSPNGKFLAWVTILGTHKETGNVGVVDLSGGDPVLATKQFDRGAFASFSPSGTVLAVAGMTADNKNKFLKGSLILYDTSTWQELRRFEKHSFEIEGLQFSSDGRFLAAARVQEEGRGYEVVLFDAKTLESLATHSEPAGSITAMAISPDGECISVGNADGKVKFLKSRK